jgi:hypothetical protein
MSIEDKIKSRLREIDGGAYEKRKLAKTKHEKYESFFLKKLEERFFKSETYLNKFSHQCLYRDTSFPGKIIFYSGCERDNIQSNWPEPEYQFVITLTDDKTNNDDSNLKMDLNVSGYLSEEEGEKLIDEEIINTPDLAWLLFEEAIIEFLVMELNRENSGPEM